MVLIAGPLWGTPKSWLNACYDYSLFHDGVSHVCICSVMKTVWSWCFVNQYGISLLYRVEVIQHPAEQTGISIATKRPVSVCP
jgi:hypothetical protein